MKRYFISLFAVCLLFLVTCSQLFAQVPQIISYQGRIADSMGEPITGTHQFTFRLYTSESGPSAIWTETHNGVFVVNGLYNVMLGSLDPFDWDDVYFSEGYWLGISIDSGTELSPRYRLGASPYAMNISDVIVKSTDQVFQTNLHLESGMAGDRAIYFGDGNWVKVGEYDGLDDNLILLSTDNPTWLDATDFRPVNSSTDLGASTNPWENLFLDGRIYVDGSSPADKVLGTDGSGNLTYLDGSSGGSGLWTDHSSASYIYANNNSNVQICDSLEDRDIFLNMTEAKYGIEISQNSDAADNNGIYVRNWNASGRHGIYSYETDGFTGDGYSPSTARARIAGYDWTTNSYEFGVAGWAYLDQNRSGAVLGANHNGSIFGALVYRDGSESETDGEVYAGYFNGDVKITGDLIIDGNIGAVDTNIYVVSYNEFIMTDADDDSLRRYFAGRLSMKSTPSSDVYAVAPVHLPQGATIVKISSYWYDNDSSEDITIQFKRNYYENEVAWSYTLAELNSSGSGGIGTTDWTGTRTIDYTDDGAWTGISYGVRVMYPSGINTNTGLRTVKLHYIE